MKKRKEEKSNKFPNNKMIEPNNNSYITKQTGIYKGFLIYDKVLKSEENNYPKLTNQSNEPPLKDWLIIQHTNKTKSRFSKLFKEILENDKKAEKNIENINSINDEKFIPKNLIEDDDDKEEEKNLNDNNMNKIDNINEEMNNLKVNENIIEKRNNHLNNVDNFNINNNIIEKNCIGLNNLDNYKNDNIINNNYIDNSFNNKENKIKINNDNSINKNINIINNFPNFINIDNNNKNNNNIMNHNIFLNYDSCPKKIPDYASSNPSLGIPSSSSTAPSSMDMRNSLFSGSLSSSGVFFSLKNDSNNSSNNTSIINSNINNNKDYLNFSNKNKKNEPTHRPSEKKFDLNIDIKRIIYLEDRRTTLMIKNIPNKFHRDILLKIIDQNFKGAYDLFILPTDANGYKNFGYSFINFTNCYYIPYFYFLFHKKTWSSTNSKKVCQITYSKIQGRNSLLSHYSNKIIFKSSEVKKYDVDTKFIIPNEYYNLFNNAFPNYNVEKFEFYFVTKMPFRY